MDTGFGQESSHLKCGLPLQKQKTNYGVIAVENSEADADSLAALEMGLCRCDLCGGLHGRTRLEVHESAHDRWAQASLRVRPCGTYVVRPREAGEPLGHARSALGAPGLRVETVEA